MDAAKVVILDENSPCGCFDAEGIPRTIPADYENTTKGPTVFDGRFCAELPVGVRKLCDAIYPFGPDSAANARGQEPPVIFRDRFKLGFKRR